MYIVVNKIKEQRGVLVALGYLCTHSTYIRFLGDILSILVDHTVLVDLG